MAVPAGAARMAAPANILPGIGLALTITLFANHEGHQVYASENGGKLNIAMIRPATHGLFS
jgi:hypothetical protein